MCITSSAAGVRASAQQPKLFVGVILILALRRALALYGMIGDHLSSSASAATGGGAFVRSVRSFVRFGSVREEKSNQITHPRTNERTNERPRIAAERTRRASDL